MQNPLIKKWDHVAYSYFQQGISMRNDQYRLTKYFRNEMPVIELYDHKKDPFENSNVADQKSKIVNRLLPVLEKGNTGLYRKSRCTACGVDLLRVELPSALKRVYP